ncbi:MAG TPA: NADH-quinone oxidoreductase subunit M [Polyangiales bacterium]|nr:NADH-quinone oxidoreductase subunit M [Polyangiales bacterium]
MSLETSPVLSVMCALPLLAAGVLMFTPRQEVTAIRRFTLLAMIAVFALSLCLLGADYSTGALQFNERYVLLPAHGITYSVGVDGLSLWLVLLTTFITPLATYASWTHIDTKLKEYAISMLLLESVVLGGFVSLDLFLFFAFWELTVIPVFLMIGIWGNGRRIRAASKFLLFTVAGSSLMLVAILYIAAQFHAQTGHYSFELRELKLLLVPASVQVWLFAAFALAFAIKVPMFPVHTWLPDAYTQAPMAGTVMLSAVMAKLATYGFLRFAMPLFPWGSQRASLALVLLATFGIIYGAYCAWAQSDLKRVVAYSSVSHLGFVMLGIYSLNSNGLRGAILQMVNHGVTIAALFLLVGAMDERRKTRKLDEFGGIAKVMPAYAVVLVIVTMSAIGVPTTNGFVSEFMILAGAFTSGRLAEHGTIAALFAATALFLGPIYLLRLVSKVLWGPLHNPDNQNLSDLTTRERLVFVPLLALIFYIGLVPNQMLGPMTASVDRFAVEYTAKLRASEASPNARAMLDQDYAPVDPTPSEPAPKERSKFASTIPRY